MFLLDHVSITVCDLPTARTFYDAIMQALGAEKVLDQEDAIGYGRRCNVSDPNSTYLAVYYSPEASSDPARHFCFKARSHTEVERFYAAGLASGGADNGAPGLRSHYHSHYFSAMLLDPEGNYVEAVCHVAE